MPAFLLPVLGFFKGVPRWVWIALAAVAVLTAGIVWHQHRARAAIQAAVKREDAAWASRLADAEKRAQAARMEAEKTSAAISENVRKQNDQANRTIAADAAALRLRGPGAASCRQVDYPRVSAGAGRSIAASAKSDAAGPQVPSDDLAAVPWQWLTGRAEEHDQLRAETLAWRDWYAKQFAAWEKMRKP